MRLIRADGTSVEIQSGGLLVELCVREPANRGILIQLALQIGRQSATNAAMLTSLATSGVSAVHSPASPVAGTIARDPSGLSRAVDAWLEDLRTLRKKKKTIAAYRQMLVRAMKDQGWTATEDITYESVSAWLGSRGWMGTTYNRNLSLFRSLTRYMFITKLICEDPLASAPRVADDGREGARAGTTEEFRALIGRAWIRGQMDRRCKGDRDVYWACLAMHACRQDEPARWRVRHVNLDHEVPHIHWTKDIQKNGTERWLALSPVLVVVLREYKSRVNRIRAEKGLSPLASEDRFFQFVPNKATFVSDRDQAGIAPVDWRGRPFTSHSARKWFSTSLTAAKVSEKMVDFLMRHAGRPEHRYYDPDLREQLVEISKLESLWHKPLILPEIQVRLPENAARPLTTDGQIAEDTQATSAASKKKTTSIESPTRRAAQMSQSNGVAKRVGDSNEALDTPVKSQGVPRLVESSQNFAASNAEGRPQKSEDANDIADLLEAIARVIRNGSSGYAVRDKAG